MVSVVSLKGLAIDKDRPCTKNALKKAMKLKEGVIWYLVQALDVGTT